MLRVANILPESVVDGSGIRTVVFFQGCLHHCPGCHNPDLLELCGGTAYTVEELADSIIEELTALHKGVTFSGGDPLLQAEELEKLIIILRQRRPHINIWLYTGYVYENISGWPVLRGVDVLVDGPFKEGERDLLLRFRGSANQKIIDIPKSLATGQTIEYQLPD